ncbi:adenosine 5'-monophosphoramidase HINT1-like isoform X3 [Ruditapes philippinarum]|uniref:adenosine 5'-monophosphoramidase HINT1-like isoform X3 n=1 Tax=Ruditapes philippinarum TaxID=129788 RepID=UPI00295AB869|nr:adenosine 5'-monophosphoramidase HINT1-like isoform X3 [Ruditapes philippinarum]
MADEDGDTIFGKIIRGDIKGPPFLHEDDKCIALKDIHPQAPIHFLVISKQEIKTIDSINETQKELLGHMMWVATKVAKDQGATNGYRIVVNDGSDGGQHVFHLHFHVLAGRKMSWPPG